MSPTRFTAALLAIMLMAAPASAQQAPAAGAQPSTGAAAPGMTPAGKQKRKLPPKVQAARDEALKACSAEADAKKLHRQERRAFRVDCMKKAMGEFRAKRKAERDARAAARAGKARGGAPAADAGAAKPVEAKPAGTMPAEANPPAARPADGAAKP